ncbi:MAG TPA: hypothetical protein VHV10_14915 [Ktedonobacteraceae bacterium]|jgi:hypothetical protein|nr:hypothetical protein [Ktedonobacteraceae bacterium]
MWTVISGVDLTPYIPHETITFSGSINDPQATGSLEVDDQGSLLNFDIGDEVIFWDENAPPEGTLHGPVAATPAHNMLLTGAFATGWTAINALAGNFTLTDGGTTVTLTFSNSTGQGLQVQECPFGYVHVGQQYMLSVYATITSPLVNAQAQVMLQFLDGSGNALATNVLTFTSTTGNTTQRVSISATAPANAVFAQALLGGQTTVNGSNSHSVKYGSPQLEPMWFSSVAYPTNDCNNAQADCAAMPDGTVSRACRLFSGYIQDYQIDYDGPNRIWQLSLASSGSILENGLVNGAFEGQYDDQIISSVISAYFSGLLSIAAPNVVAANPVIRGALIDSVSYNDNTLREVMNGLSDASGYMYYVDPYFTLRYNPAYYTAAPFSLTDATPDDIVTFNYYDYHIESDGSQRKRNVKVTGGKFIAPQITDTFSASGSTAVFTLSQQPYSVVSCVSNGNAQKSFFSGSGPTLGSGGYTCKIDKTQMTMTFSFNPTSGTNNVSCTYTYEAPVCVLVQSQSSANLPVAPAYAIPNYDSKVNDTNLQSIPAAIQRGLAELSKFADPQVILTLKSGQYASAGTTIFVTATLDNITNQPFVVQKVDASYLGNGINEYVYTLGPYRPTLLDHIRNLNKAVNRSKTTANVNTPQQTDIVFSENMFYSEKITFTVQSLPTSTYGTGHYGSNSYA